MNDEDDPSAPLPPPLEDAPSVEIKGLGLRGLVIGKVGGHKRVVQGKFGVL